MCIFRVLKVLRKVDLNTNLSLQVGIKIFFRLNTNKISKGLYNSLQEWPTWNGELWNSTQIGTLSLLSLHNVKSWDHLWKTNKEDLTIQWPWLKIWSAWLGLPKWKRKNPLVRLWTPSTQIPYGVQILENYSHSILLDGVWPTKYPMRVLFSTQVQGLSNSLIFKSRLGEELPHETPWRQTYVVVCVDT